MSINTSMTRDGGHPWHGTQYHLLCRLADPGETVYIVDYEPWVPAQSSMLTGQKIQRYIVENQRGERFVVEPWMLSRVPADELYRNLRASPFVLSVKQPASMRVPVEAVRLTA